MDAIRLHARTPAPRLHHACTTPTGLEVPVVFASGVLLGDAAKVLYLNETGELKSLMRGYAEAPSGDCQICGAAGYINCTWCQGSGKSMSTNFDTANTAIAGGTKALSLKCSLCNENGLQRCPEC